MKNSIRPRNRVVSKLHTAFIGLLTTFLLLPTAFGESVNSDDVRYTISPVVGGTIWNNDQGLKDGFLYGGKVGIDFGSMIALEAYYFRSNRLRTDFGRIALTDTAGLAVDNQRVEVRPCRWRPSSQAAIRPTDAFYKGWRRSYPIRTGFGCKIGEGGSTTWRRS